MDKAFSVNVDVFWTRRPTRGLAALRATLGPGPGEEDEVTPMVANTLRENGFTDVEVLRSEAGMGVRGVNGG